MVEMKSLEEEDPDRFGRQMHHPSGGQQQQQPIMDHMQEGGNQRRFNSKRDIIDSLCTSVNQDLLISKTFYFFFFSAFGSLFPLLAVYFKQLGMNPTQSGLLIGFRPFVEFLSAPLWGSMADRFHKGKHMLMFSLFCWIVFTLSLAFIQPPASSCVLFNNTHHVLYTPNADRDKRSVLEATPLQSYYNEEEVGDFNYSQEVWPEEADFIDDVAQEEAKRAKWAMKQSKIVAANPSATNKDKRNDKNKQHKLPPNYVVGKSPNSVDYTLNYKHDEKTVYVSPPFSSMVYKWEDVQEVFFLLLLLVLLGEFFSAPAITLADSVTLTYLSDNADNYGKQRMFGSLGWGLAMFFVGIALDHSTSFPDHPCSPHDRERNYTICFATFSVLMGCALIAATQFRFDYDGSDDSMQMKPVQNGPQVGQTTVNIQDGMALGAPAEGDKPEPAKSTVFAQTTRRLPEWFSVIRTFATIRYGAFLYVTWFMGFGIGLVFTFLFWHLQDLGGTPTLFGVASVINHISEIFAYFFSFKFIKQIGHVKVLCIGLIGNICRFLYISWLRNPWWVLPFEFIQGITHAAVWAACCSYITQATPSNLRTSAQGVLQGLHHGLGRGCGAIIGGIFVNYFGTQITFRGYGFACLIVLILFIFINYYRRDRGFSNFQDEQEPEMVMEETSHLAPHGVPTNPMARSLSKQNIPEVDKGHGGNGYGGVGHQPNKTSGGFLDLPDNSGGYYSGGGTNYADFNMNTTSRGRLSRGTLAAAFNPKGLLASASSPEGHMEYDSIRNDFQAYREALSDLENERLVKSSELLSAPRPKTSLFTPQPYAKEEVLQYDW